MRGREGCSGIKRVSKIGYRNLQNTNTHTLIGAYSRPIKRTECPLVDHKPVNVVVQFVFGATSTTGYTSVGGLAMEISLPLFLYMILLARTKCVRF